MKPWRRIAALFGMSLGTSAVWLAFSYYRVFSSAPSFFQWSGKDYAFLAVLALLGLGLIVVAYCFGFRWGAEPTALPSGGPAKPPDNSGAPVGLNR